MPYITIGFFPFPFLIGLLLLFLLFLWQRKRGLIYSIALILFGIYIFILLKVVFFPITIPPGWPGDITLQNILREISRINLIPLRYTRTFRFTRSILFVEILGNILLTMPVGFLLPFLVRIPPRRIFWIALATGLALEVTQLLSEMLGIIAGYPHKVDISDVITNGTGVIAGYALYRIVGWIWPEIKMMFHPSGVIYP